MNDIDPKNIQPFLRICIILFLVMAVYAVIGIKLWHIQVLSGNKYTAKTSRQYARKIRIPAVRGRIFSSDGNLLAENRASYDVVFHLSEMRKPGRMSKTVNHIMGELARVSDSLGRRCEVTVMDIRHHMNYYPGLPITVFKDLTPAELAKVSELTPVVEGMEVTVETARHFGIGKDRAVNYRSDKRGTRLNYEVVSDAICTVRACAPLSADWEEKIDEDYERRR